MFLCFTTLFISRFKLDFEFQFSELFYVLVTFLFYFCFFMVKTKCQCPYYVHNFTIFTRKPVVRTSRKRNRILDQFMVTVRSFCFPERMALSQQWANEKHYVCFKGSFSLSLSLCSSHFYIRTSCGVWGWMNGSLWFGCHFCIKLCFFLSLDTGMTKVLEQCNLMFPLWHCYTIKKHINSPLRLQKCIFDVVL